MRKKRITPEQARHPVARVSGVTEADSPVEAAEKAIATMRAAGFSRRSIQKAEQMLADAKARGIK